MWHWWMGEFLFLMIPMIDIDVFEIVPSILDFSSERCKNFAFFFMIEWPLQILIYSGCITSISCTYFSKLLSTDLYPLTLLLLHWCLRDHKSDQKHQLNCKYCLSSGNAIIEFISVLVITFMLLNELRSWQIHIQKPVFLCHILFHFKDC